MVLTVLTDTVTEQVTEAVETVAETAAKAPSNLFVIIMGLCTVFIGLICIIAICYLMSAVVRKLDARKPAPAVEAPAPAASAAPAPIENRGELVAAISAAIAEELGKDVSGIRILSIKRL